MSDYEAVGRAVERISGARTRGQTVIWRDEVYETWRAESSTKGEHATGDTLGEAMIALAEQVDPSWETRLREGCEALECIPVIHASTLVKGSMYVAVKTNVFGSTRRVVTVSPSREAACRAALAALDVLYPPNR